MRVLWRAPPATVFPRHEYSAADRVYRTIDRRERRGSRYASGGKKEDSQKGGGGREEGRGRGGGGRGLVSDPVQGCIQRHPCLSRRRYCIFPHSSSSSSSFSSFSSSFSLTSPSNRCSFPFIFFFFFFFYSSPSSLSGHRVDDAMIPSSGNKGEEGRRGEGKRVESVPSSSLWRRSGTCLYRFHLSRGCIAMIRLASSLLSLSLSFSLSLFLYPFQRRFFPLRLRDNTQT